MPFPFGEICHQDIYRKALKSKYGEIFDLVVGLCKGWQCVFRGLGIVGTGLLPGITSVVDLTTGSLEVGTVPGFMAAIHEMGHNFGLYHVKAGCREGGPCQGPNASDCKEPDRKNFIMDYCYPMEYFGPAAYRYLKNVIFKDYLK